MPFKVTFIGARSIEFSRKLLSDLLSAPEFKNIEVAFTDINEENLDMVTKLCQRDIDINWVDIKIQSTTDRRTALKNAKYIFHVFRIGGLEAFKTDVEIPLKYGVGQCVGDTLSAGGIMYGQRGIAEILNFCKVIREVSLKVCLLLNYSNPTAMITWACNKRKCLSNNNKLNNLFNQFYLLFPVWHNKVNFKGEFHYEKQYRNA